MSGKEALKGFGFQIYVMLLCCLESCIKGYDFDIVGEPAKNKDIGDFVDITLFLRSEKESPRKLIQVKKSITSTKAKEVINEFINCHLDGQDIELWFAEYVLENKMKLIDLLDKLKSAISTDGFAENEIQCNISGKELIICIDNTVNGFLLQNDCLKISNINILDGDAKNEIEKEILKSYKIDKKSIIPRIKQSLNETLEYRRYIFLESLGPEEAIRKRIIEKGYEYFKNITIRQLSEKELHFDIERILPGKLNQTQKEILKDVLFSHFYKFSSESNVVTKNKTEHIIINTIKSFGIKCDHIKWDSKSIHGTLHSDIVDSIPEGDFSMGEY